MMRKCQKCFCVTLGKSNRKIRFVNYKKGRDDYIFSKHKY